MSISFHHFTFLKALKVLSFSQAFSLVLSIQLSSLKFKSIKLPTSRIKASMADKKAARLAKMNAQTRTGTHIIIHSPYVSIQDLLNERGDEYPSVSELDSFDHSNRFHDKKEIKKYNKLFNLPSYLELIHPEGGDRTCHWDPQRLCVYRDALMAGLRFPFHEFIVRLLAAVRIHPCQVVPNGWRGIFCFMVLCIRKNIPLSVACLGRYFSLKIAPPSLLVGSTLTNVRGPPIFSTVCPFLRITLNGGMNS